MCHPEGNAKGAVAEQECEEKERNDEIDIGPKKKPTDEEEEDEEKTPAPGGEGESGGQRRVGSVMMHFTSKQNAGSSHCPDKDRS